MYMYIILDDFNFRIDNTKLEYIFEPHVLFNRNLMCLFTIYIATNTSCMTNILFLFCFVLVNLCQYTCITQHTQYYACCLLNGCYLLDLFSSYFINHLIIYCLPFLI